MDGVWDRINPEEAARQYARDHWWPRSPEDAAEEEFERWLKDFLCEELQIGCEEPESL